MAWISFGALPCREKKTWWQPASRCCWNRARPWYASELVPFLVELRSYQHPGKLRHVRPSDRGSKGSVCDHLRIASWTCTEEWRYSCACSGLLLKSSWRKQKVWVYEAKAGIGLWYKEEKFYWKYRWPSIESLVSKKGKLHPCTGTEWSRGKAILYRHWGYVQTVRPIGGVEV